MTLRRWLGYSVSKAEVGILALGFCFLATVATSAQDVEPNPCDQLVLKPQTPYARTISELTRIRHRNDITEFLDTFDRRKKTIILLHGGMGSELWQTRQSFDPKRDPADYRFRGREAWLDLRKLIIWGNLKELRIYPNNRDFSDQIIVADSAVQAPLVNPYKDTLTCFRKAFGFNAYLLAWDSRRNLMVAVEELRSIIERIKNDKEYQLHKLFIVGHSMGGMVAKVFLEKNPNLAGDIGGLITVGTPFYGYLGQLRRMFNGEPILNNRQAYDAREVAEIISSVPGFYTILPIDSGTYKRIKSQCKKQAPPSWCDDWPKNYPVTDLHGNVADAYKGTHEFPEWVRRDELPEALMLRHCLAKPLPNSLRGKVFHIRSKGEKTAVTAKWRQKLCPPSQSDCDYDATQRLSPIKDEDIETGDGDDTIPYWSAALISTPAGHTVNLARGSHMTLMVQSAVLREIYKIVNAVPASEELMAKCDVDLPPMATHQELEAELQKLDEMDPDALKTLGEGLGLSVPARWRLLQELGM